MKHQYYPKIESNSNNFKVSVSANTQWVATEKIHGANFVIGIDNGSVLFGKRKSWLQDNDPFFGWQVIRNTLEVSAKEVFSKFNDISKLYIYGELFGGEYPHPQVKNRQILTPVQTGVWYSPDLQYAVFDILVIRNGVPTFLKFSKVEEVISTTQLITVPVLAYGKFDALKELPVRYKSKVYKILGLPGIENNYAEGFVLKPDIELQAEKRPVVKYKIPEFSENRFDESQAFNPLSMPDINEIVDIVTMMVNVARIEGARSKVGENIDNIIEESVLDILVDLELIFPLKMSQLSEYEESFITEKIKDNIEKFLSTH
jgi:Rnl2 family RNA ligase